MDMMTNLPISFIIFVRLQGLGFEAWRVYKKIRIRDLVFPEIWKNRFWREIIKYFHENLRIYILKIAEIIVTKMISKRLYKFSSVTYYLLRRKGRATSKSVEGTQLRPPLRLKARGEATSMI